MNNIQKILNTTKRNGGCSMNPVTGEVPTSGYMVATNPDFEKRLPRINYADIEAYAAEHDALFSAPKSFMFLGTWKHNGITMLDVSMRFEGKQAALDFAKVGGQLAIYDIAKQIDIEVESC